MMPGIDPKLHEATVDEVKITLGDARRVIRRLPSNDHAEQAEKALDSCMDHALRSIEASQGGVLSPSLMGPFVVGKG
jgi:hypothetical protein